MIGKRPRHGRGAVGAQGARRPLAAVLALVAMLLAGTVSAWALDPITLAPDQDRIEISSRSDIYERTGDTLPVETAPGPDGATDRIVVRSSTPGINPSWLVFALHNPTEKAMEVWLTADRYTAAGSGFISPDLDARRIAAVTHSSGFAPERIRNDRVDIFRLTIERGQTVTYVAEMVTERFSRVYLWKPLEYEQRQRDRYLFNGIMLGVMGLMAIFLTAVFAANHKMIFPSAALVAWCMLGLLCVDFGFWHKLFQMRPEDNAQYRAAGEAAVAASLVIFLFTFLRVNLWHGFARVLFLAWIVGQLSIVALAVLDPRLAATIARLSIGVIGLVGALIIGFLAVRRLERALALVPTWIFFLVWLFGAAVTLSGRLPGEMAVSGLVAGLVLIMVLIGFTVTQFAFRANEPVYGVNPSLRQLKLAAIEQSGVSVWEWSARRHEIKFDAQIEAALGLAPGELPTKVEDFLALLHPADRERFDANLQTIRQKDGGALRLDVRLRHADSSYRCFELDGATVPTHDRRALRCVGIVRDVTDAKRSQERLLTNAVHDSLTGLPNRELFFDRVDGALVRARTERSVNPTVFFIDLDDFRAVNTSVGLIVGDTILLTVSRRLARSLGAQDTLARIGGDQFALLVLGQHDARELARLADQLRLALRAPIRIANQEIVLTGSIGIAVFDRTQPDARTLLRDAEVAMSRAKSAGPDRLEIFRSDMRAEKDARDGLEADLRRAIGGNQIKVLYQPIVTLSNEELIGFEALVRWEHPTLGTKWPVDFEPIAEQSDVMVQLGAWVLGRAVADLARWQKELPRPEQPLFVSVNISSRQLIKPELAQEVRHVIGRAVIPSSSLRLEIPEALVMANPEQATQILELLHEAGVGLSLDEFGAGYSSPAFLARFPFDTIKIDKALVQFSTQVEGGAAIMRSMVALAHELGKRILADGVESPEDAAFLRAMGCEAAQGFYYGGPMGEGEVSRLLKLVRKSDRRMRRRGMVRAPEKKKAPSPPPRSGPDVATAPPPARTPQPSPNAPTGSPRPQALLPGPPHQPVSGSPARPRAPTGDGRVTSTESVATSTPPFRPPSPAGARPLPHQSQPVLSSGPRPTGHSSQSAPLSGGPPPQSRSTSGLPPAIAFPAPQPRPLPSTPPRSAPQQTAAASLATLQATLSGSGPADSKGNTPAGRAPSPGERQLSPDLRASLDKVASGGRAPPAPGRPDPEPPVLSPPKSAAE